MPRLAPVTSTAAPATVVPFMLIAPPSGPSGRAAGARARPARRPAPAPRCPRRAGAPPPARRPRARSRAPAPVALLGLRGVRHRRREDRRLVVLVVQVPPRVGVGLRVAVGGVLPRLLAAERRHVE